MEGPPKIMRSFPETEKKSSRSCADAFNLVRECSKEHTPRSFCIKLLELLKTLCPYDMAAILFLMPITKFPACIPLAGSAGN